MVTHNFPMRFAEIIDELGKRIHIGCIMAVGSDWVEVSLPDQMQLVARLQVRFLPTMESHGVKAEWRAADRVGFTFTGGGPPEEHFAGLFGLLDARPASLKRRP